MENRKIYIRFQQFTFNGKERDSETGYSYFGARYYDSGIPNIFLSVDPMADKYPSISPYAYCAWNPIKLVDPNGKEFDPATEEKYIKPYEKEITTRIKKINSLRNTSKWKSEYQNQLDEYNTILGEINDLRNDGNNVYSIQTGFNFDDKTTTGEIRYAGQNNGKSQINILIGSKHKSIYMFMGDVAHELKHAHQFYKGDLSFFCDENMKYISSSNTKELERAANLRGDMFVDCVTNGRPMKYNYSLDVKNYPLSSQYNDTPDDKSGVIHVGKYEIKNTPK